MRRHMSAARSLVHLVENKLGMHGGLDISKSMRVRAEGNRGREKQGEVQEVRSAPSPFCTPPTFLLCPLKPL